MKKFICAVLLITVLFSISSCKKKEDSSSTETVKLNSSDKIKFADYVEPSKSKGKATLTLIGHASVKIVTKEGIVIYIDPFYEGDYTQKADLLLITHNHEDCNRRHLVTLKDDGEFYQSSDFVKKDVYSKFEAKGIKIEAVPARNYNHGIGDHVGLLLTFDGITVYHASDTLNIKEMKALADKNITYALLPADGILNMTMQEATDCSNIINAKHTIPFHLGMWQEPYDKKYADTFKANTRLLVEYGKTIELNP